jgi:hypothetical protein
MKVTAHIRPLATCGVALAACVAASVVVAFATPPSAAGADLAWSRAVAQICAGGLLFEGRHEIGTRAGALAVAEDIRATTRRRLVLVAALSPPAGLQAIAARWITIEEHLAAIYAHSYVRIFDVIDAGSAPGQREQEAQIIGRLLRAPDRFRQTAALIERRLRVPDCTGGANPAPPMSSMTTVTTTPR